MAALVSAGVLDAMHCAVQSAISAHQSVNALSMCMFVVDWRGTSWTVEPGGVKWGLMSCQRLLHLYGHMHAHVFVG